jgi:hypothetical protein
MSELDLIVGTIFVAMGALLFWRAPAQARSHRQELINAGAGDEADKKSSHMLWICRVSGVCAFVTGAYLTLTSLLA